jgi:hypothetical protein
MKILINYASFISMLTFVAICQSINAQGTFQNLNFESANVTGYSPGNMVPISVALPSWSAYFNSSLSGIEPATQISYDGISTGGPVISLVDDNVGVSHFDPLQGNYSVILFGGVGVSASIDQTATITAGTQSLMMDAWSYDASPIVAINGVPINMIPLQTFANYTLYGGTVPAADVGPSVTLSFTEPAPATGGPSEFELDNIAFSSNAVPEPSPLALTGFGGILFALYRRFAPNRR